MRFRIPKTFRVAGVEHTVALVEHLAGNDGLKGSFCTFTRSAQIERTLPPSEAWRTFWHEALHAGDDLLKMGLTDDNVERLAIVICELLEQLEPEP